MFKRNRYPELVSLVSLIAEDEKNGALSRRAKDLLQSGNTNGSQNNQTGTK